MSGSNYLSNIPDSAFDEIVPRRMEIINKAPDSFPKYEYNANVLAERLHPSVQHVVVSEIKELKDAKLYTLVPDKESGTESLAYFRAGQYISLSLKIGSSVLTRPYSLCGAPSSSKYRILVKSMKNGFASEYINTEFKVGTKIDVSAPCGNFCYEPLRDAKTIVGIVGGSGIAPFVSLAGSIAEGIDDADLVLLYGSRTSEDILLGGELDDLARRCGRIKVVHVLSDEEAEGYEHGFITSGLIAKYAPEDGYSVFVCGSQGMYDYISGEVSKLGIRKKFLRLDAYGEYRLTDRDAEFVNANRDKTYELTVVMNDGIARKVPANASESLLVALERAGIKAPSHCRSGECGFCRSRLASGEVYIPSGTDGRREYDKHNKYIHPCCTFPASDCKLLIDYEEPKVERTVKDMKKKERTMGLVMSILISAAMGALAAFLVLKANPEAAGDRPVFMMYLSNILLSIVVGVLVALFIPLGKLGRGLAAKAGANPPSMKFNLLNSIPLAVGNTLIVSLIVSLFGVVMGRANMPPEVQAQVPFIPMWLGNWAKLLLPTLILSYVLAVVLSPMVSQMVGLAGAGAEVGRAAEEK